MTGKRYLALMLGVALAAGAPATATTTELSGADDMRARLELAEQRIAELEGSNSENWLNGRRTEEIKTLIREVLQDADTRASLVEGGSAGHNGSNFFLSSEDGGFLLMIGGHIQVRHIFNTRRDGTDEHESGFEVPRARLKFSGHIASPRLNYRVIVNLDREDNDGLFEEALISYEVIDGMTVWAGETKSPFLREELIDSAHQLAVERSLVNEVFTLGYVQGIGIDWYVDRGSSDMFRVRASFNDGIRSAETEADNDADLHIENDDTNDKAFNQDASDLAFTTRVDLRLLGTWEQAEDFTSWSGEDTSVVIGAAGHYEVAETGDTAANGQFWTWTVDASAECHGWNLYGAVVGLHSDEEDDTGIDRDYYGYVLQGGYQLVPDKLEPFLRWEVIDLSPVENTTQDEEINILTAGLNWYLNKHTAKITTDVVWSLNGIPSANDLGMSAHNLGLLGLLADDADRNDQVVFRMQFQLLF